MHTLYGPLHAVLPSSAAPLLEGTSNGYTAAYLYIHTARGTCARARVLRPTPRGTRWPPSSPAYSVYILAAVAQPESLSTSRLSSVSSPVASNSIHRPPADSHTPEEAQQTSDILASGAPLRPRSATTSGLRSLRLPGLPVSHRLWLGTHHHENVNSSLD